MSMGVNILLQLFFVWHLMGRCQAVDPLYACCGHGAQLVLSLQREEGQLSYHATVLLVYQSLGSVLSEHLVPVAFCSLVTC